MSCMAARRIAFSIIAATFLACSDVTAPGPSAPEGVSASLVTSTSVRLVWSARPRAEKVTTYAVYRTGVRIGVTSDAAFTDSGLAENATLTYSVSSMLASGYESSQSEPVSIATRDVTAPTIVQSLPANGAGPLYWEDVTVSLVFSEAMDSTSINETTFRVRVGPIGEAAPGTISYLKRDHIAEFHGPFGRMPAGTTIVVSAAGMKDVSGNVLASPLTFSFTTSENIAPYIVSTTP